MNNANVFFGNKDTATIHQTQFECHNFNDEILNTYHLNQFIMLKQVHEQHGFIVTPQVFSEALSVAEHKGDFLVTDRPLVGLAVITADCLPVIAVDKKRNVIGIAHAGWRGTVKKIVPTMIATMHDVYGSAYADMEFYFGPYGRPCCYEVQPDFLQHLEPFGWIDHVIIQRGKKLFFDTSVCNQLQLYEKGIKPSQIVHHALECTICDHMFHSHRRDGSESKRNLTMVWLA